MEDHLNTTNTSPITNVMPNASISVISNTIQVRAFAAVPDLAPFGLPIMPEGFITGTGLLQDARPIKQL
jgi:hypothetical protein